MTQTIIDASDRTFLVLRAAVVKHESSDADDGGTRWCAQVCDPASPLAGLYAFGDSLDGAREALAVAAWAAIEEEGLAPYDIAVDGLAGVRIAATSTRSYDGAWLHAARAYDVA